MLKISVKLNTNNLSISRYFFNLIIVQKNKLVINYYFSYLIK